MNSERENGFLVISLDFELLWGVFDVVDAKKNENIFLNTRKLIPEILLIFKKFNVRSTWATVGMLFNKNWEEWLHNIPGDLPEYKNKNLSAYDFGRKNLNTNIENYCFAPELIRIIHDEEGQEIGTHTYSHYYCLEPGQNCNQFEEDIQKAIAVAQEAEMRIRSLVLPRNQINKSYLDTCLERGIVNVRTNPESWYWQNSRSELLITKLARSGDAYLPLGKKSFPLHLESQANEIQDVYLQKASRFLRPVENNSFMRYLKINRVILEMEKAARNNEVYHLWWHPHNFGKNPVESLKDLNSILGHFVHLRNTYGFTSINMGELGDILAREKS